MLRPLVESCKHLIAGNQRADFAGLRLHLQRVCLDGDRLAGRAYFSRTSLRTVAATSTTMPVFGVGLEARRRRLEIIGADSQSENFIQPSCVRLRGASCACVCHA